VVGGEDVWGVDDFLFDLGVGGGMRYGWFCGRDWKGVYCLVILQRFGAITR
jgi:hypothetical protein